MESIQINARQLISRYLAGHLSANESEAFERALSEQPELRAETERFLKFKEGLARLHERGELDTLIHASAPHRWLPYAAAAATIVIAVLGGLFWFQLSSRAPTLVALSPSQLTARGHEAPPILGTYLLERTRGGASATEVTLPLAPGAIELRIVPSSLASDIKYSVRVSRFGVSTTSAIMGQIDTGFSAPDGYVTVYLDSRQLTPGDYEVLLAPLTPKEATTESDHFVIRVR